MGGITPQFGQGFMTGADRPIKISVEIERCPGCGAAVRPGVHWCSLCYRDLRPAPQLATASPVALTGLTDTSPEADTQRWGELRAWHGEDGTAREGSAESPAQAAGQSTGQPAPLRWPCACGNEVEFDQDACPVCGSAFLGDLRGEAVGRHRGAPQGPFAERWISSRAFRFIAAGVAALLIAVVIPVLLTLLG